jgi:Flp pilus assembly protein CpaB
MTHQFRNIVIAVVLALFAAVFTTFYVTNYKKTVQHGEGHIRVLVAARDIPAGTSGSEVIAQHMLKPVTVTRSALTPGWVAEPDKIARLVATQTVYAGEQVSLRRFSTANEVGIRAQLTGTLRAIQVSANPNQLMAGTLRKGDHVDLVGNFKVDNQNSNSAHYDRVVLRNLLVLRAPQPVTAKGVSAASSDYSVQLAVSDSQASKFLFTMKNADPNAASDGGWALTLRPVTKSADSPENVESIWTVLSDGLSPAQKRRLVQGG